MVKIIFNPIRGNVSRGKIPPAYPTASILQSPEVLQHCPGFLFQFEPGPRHVNIEVGFGFLALRDHTAIVIGEHDNWLAFQLWPEYFLG